MAPAAASTAAPALSPEQLHENRAPELAGSVGAFLVFSTVAVILRCYVRLFVSRGFGWDDAMIVFTLISYIIYAAFVFSGIHYGTGQHMEALAIENFQSAMKMWYFCEIFYGLASTLVRISIGMLLLRLTTLTWHRRIIWSAMVLSTTAGVCLGFTIIYQCQPINYFWLQFTSDPTEGHCIASDVLIGFIYAHGAVGCLCDWTLGILPWIMVRKLNMNRRTKITVGVLLCLANFGSVAAVVRFYCIKQIATSTDFLFATTDIAIWSSLEAGTAIPAASLITLRPLFRKFFGPYEKPSRQTPSTPSGFRCGFVGQHISSSANVKNGLRPYHDKSLLTTTITGSTNYDHEKMDVGGSTEASKRSNDNHSDELPLQIMTERGINIEYSQTGPGRAI